MSAEKHMGRHGDAELYLKLSGKTMETQEEFNKAKEGLIIRRTCF